MRSPWRDLSPNDAPDRPFVVRLKAPTDGETLIDDQVKGPVTFQNKDLDDLYDELYHLKKRVKDLEKVNKDLKKSAASGG